MCELFVVTNTNLVPFTEVSGLRKGVTELVPVVIRSRNKRKLSLRYAGFNGLCQVIYGPYQ